MYFFLLEICVRSFIVRCIKAFFEIRVNVRLNQWNFVSHAKKIKICSHGNPYLTPCDANEQSLCEPSVMYHAVTLVSSLVASCYDLILPVSYFGGQPRVYWSIPRGTERLKLARRNGHPMEFPPLATNDSLRRWSSPPFLHARASGWHTPSNLTRVHSRHYSASSPRSWTLASPEIGRRTEHLSGVSASLYRSPIYSCICVCVRFYVSRVI